MTFETRQYGGEMLRIVDHDVTLRIRDWNVNPGFQAPAVRLRCEKYAEEFFILFIRRIRI